MCRVEYCTWAGMIVTQYGRFPGSHATNGVLYNSAQGGSPPRQSAALDQLQRYYGTGDTCSEPGDFKPGTALWLVLQILQHTSAKYCCHHNTLPNLRFSERFCSSCEVR